MNVNPFKQLNKFDLFLYGCSIFLIGGCFVFSQNKDYLTLISSIFGITSLVFIVKGQVIGQVISMVFAIFYAITSFIFGYYGEFLIYIFMSFPVSLISVISWLIHPHANFKEVAVSVIKFWQIILMVFLAFLIGVSFYFILGLFNTQNLIFSAISVSTSFMGLYLSVLRSPYYALAFILNDLVLLVLWISACVLSISYLPMVICFSVFLIYDLYGFINWKIMEKRQVLAKDKKI